MTGIARGSGSRRAVTLGAVLALGFTLTGCGGGGASGSAAAAATSPASTAAAQTSPPAPASGAAPSPTPSTATPSNPPTASIGTVTLNWTPPTQNVDGSPLTNLAGYDIHYGTASGQYTQSVSVSNPGIATYVVSDLTPGTYYFSVAAVNSQGTESPMSAEVSTAVN